MNLGLRYATRGAIATSSRVYGRSVGFGVPGPSTIRPSARKVFAPRFNSTNAKPTEDPAKPSSTGTSDAKEKDLPPPLPILPRPLGVPTKPSAKAQTWEDTKRNMLDKERHVAKRKALIKEATSGYFEDFHKSMSNGYGGKTWLAPKAVIREDRALYFPDIKGKNLLSEEVHTTSIAEGKVSLVAFLPTRIAEEQVGTFTQYTVEAFKHDRNFRYIPINLQENFLKSALVSLSRGSIKNTIDQRWHATYIHSSQNMELLRQPLGLDNKHLGYVYLIDENLKIRWAGCGFAMDEEQLALVRCARILLDRLKTKQKQTQTQKGKEEVKGDKT